MNAVDRTAGRRRAAAAALAVLLTASAAVAERRLVPVFDLEEPAYSLGAEVTEVAGPARDGVRLDRRVGDLEDARSDLAKLVTAYFRAVVAGDEELWPRFYPPAPEDAGEDDARRILQAGRLLRQVARAGGEPETLRLLKVWRFADFRMVTVEVTGPGGAQVLAVGAVRDGDAFYRSDDWGRFQPVQQLFWYMARNHGKGLVERHAPRDLPVAIELAGGRPEDPVTLWLDGLWHDPAAGWIEPLGDADGSELAFAHRVLAISAAGADEEFIALWRGKERAKVVEIYGKSLGRFQGLRGDNAAQARVRDLFTATLGAYRLHYFVEESDPARVRALIFKKTAEGWSLSGKLYPNIQQLLVSPLVTEPLRQRWSAVRP